MKKISFLFGTLFLLVLFSPSFVYASNDDIVITEIAAYEKVGHEWFEIYNKGTSAVNITGWKFYENFTNHSLTPFRGDLIIDPGEYAVIADAASTTATDYPGFTGTLIDSSWTNLSTDGEPIGMRDKDTIFIEIFSYVPSIKFSLERKNSALADYTAQNWVEHASGNTIGRISSSTPPQPPQTVPTTPTAVVPSVSSTPQVSSSTPIQQTQSSSTSSIAPQLLSWKPSRGDILINEFIADPIDGAQEWVELYNAIGRPVDLAGWTLEEGSKAITPLQGTLGVAGNDRFLVIENPAGNLNNGGDVMTLFDSNRAAIDQVAYGAWEDGNIENNAPRAQDPDAVARTIDGASTFNNKYDFQITHQPTKGSSNVILAAEAPQKTLIGKTAGSGGVVISELLPNPEHTDARNEYIELQNTGTIDVDLAGWELVNESGVRFTIATSLYLPTPLLKPQEFLVISRRASHLALKNSGGDTIRLYQPNSDRPEQTVSYHDAVLPGASYSRIPGGAYRWSTTPTPGRQNTITIANKPPHIIIDMPSRAVVGSDVFFDASDTTDEDDETLAIKWEFGDGASGSGLTVRHQYGKPATYTVTMSAGDGKATVQETRTIRVSAAAATSSQNIAVVPAAPPVSTEVSLDGLVLNEIFPNPQGADKQEFIEVKNISQQNLTLVGWSIVLGDGASVALPPTTSVMPGAFAVVTRGMLRRNLKNSNDRVTLKNSASAVVDEIGYEDAPSGQALAKNADGDWIWTEHPTPGVQNNVVEYSQDQTQANTAPREQAGSTALLISPSVSREELLQNFSSPLISLEQARELPRRSVVHVRAPVAVEPGVLGKNTFYLSGSGIQVHTAGDISSPVKVGDIVELVGTLGTSLGEPRINIGTDTSLHVVSHGTPPPPHEQAAGDIDQELSGSLVRVAGTVTELQWPQFLLDDGNDQVKVSIKKTTHIKKMQIANGDQIAVVGIVGKSGDSYRILPRTEEDIVVSHSTSSPSDSSNSENVTIPSREHDTKQVAWYLGSTALALFIGGVIFFVQRSRK